jgi:general secretion pathway protein G
MRNELMTAETGKFAAGGSTEAEKRTLGVPRIHLANGAPSTEAFGVNLGNFSPAAFSLIEMLFVLVIISILAGLVIGAAKYASTKAATSRTQSEIAAMEMALEHYKNDNGIYPKSTTFRNSPSPPGLPTTIEIYNSTNLYSALSGRYFTFTPNQTRVDPATGHAYVVDPFGSPYNYYCYPGQVWSNQATFDLWSYGSNGRNDEGTNDDITNWQQH